MLSVKMFLGGVCLGKGELSERDDDNHVGEGETSGVMALRFCLVSRPGYSVVHPHSALRTSLAGTSEVSCSLVWSPHNVVEQETLKDNASDSTTPFR